MMHSVYVCFYDVYVLSSRLQACPEGVHHGMNNIGGRFVLILHVGYMLGV